MNFSKRLVFFVSICIALIADLLILPCTGTCQPSTFETFPLEIIRPRPGALWYTCGIYPIKYQSYIGELVNPRIFIYHQRTANRRPILKDVIQLNPSELRILYSVPEDWETGNGYRVVIKGTACNTGQLYKVTSQPFTVYNRGGVC